MDIIKFINYKIGYKNLTKYQKLMLKYYEEYDKVFFYNSRNLRTSIILFLSALHYMLTKNKNVYVYGTLNISNIFYNFLKNNTKLQIYNINKYKYNNKINITKENHILISTDLYLMENYDFIILDNINNFLDNKIIYENCKNKKILASGIYSDNKDYNKYYVNNKDFIKLNGYYFFNKENVKYLKKEFGLDYMIKSNEFKFIKYKYTFHNISEKDYILKQKIKSIYDV